MFLLRENLGTLARYLRFLGYDAKLLKKISFTRFKKIAGREKRVMLSRSLSESKQGAILLKDNDPWLQLKVLKSRLEYREDLLFSRCPHDNTLLERAKNPQNIPAAVLERGLSINYCPLCGSYFWIGKQTEEIKRNLTIFFSNPTID